MLKFLSNAHACRCQTFVHTEHYSALWGILYLHRTEVWQYFVWLSNERTIWHVTCHAFAFRKFHNHYTRVTVQYLCGQWGTRRVVAAPFLLSVHRVLYCCSLTNPKVFVHTREEEKHMTHESFSVWSLKCVQQLAAIGEACFVAVMTAVDAGQRVFALDWKEAGTQETASELFTNLIRLEL